MRLIVAVGARPNVVKAAPLLPELISADIEVQVAFTGSREVGREDAEGGPPSFYGVGMAAPRWYLDVGADTNAVQIGRALAAFEQLLDKERPDAVLVIGDVNPTLAAAIAAARAAIPVAHLGGGLRCGNAGMPEEINRLLVSRIASMHLVPTEEAVENLVREGVDAERIHFVGNMMAESVLKHLDEVKRTDAAGEHGLKRDEYVLGSFHRPENLGSKAKLELLLAGLGSIPGTVAVPDIASIGELANHHGLEIPRNVRLLPAVPYRSMLALERDARCVVTDSGGVQEETCTICTPCVTVRECTEHVATIATGGNRLSSPGPAALSAAVNAASGGKRTWAPPSRWDKAVSGRIVRVLKRGVPAL